VFEGRKRERERERERESALACVYACKKDGDKEERKLSVNKRY